MAATASVSARKFVEFLRAPDTGVGAAIGQLALERGVEAGPIAPEQIRGQNVAPELAEKATIAHYPVIHVYADRVRNLQTEKWRVFSGKVRTVAEVRVSQDRVEGIEEQLHLCVDGVVQVLDGSRGNWGEGAFFSGGYEVQYDQVKRGGKNLLQIARVSFEVDLSK